MIIRKICINCLNEFDATSNKQVVCSGACRMAVYRNKNNNKKSVKVATIKAATDALRSRKSPKVKKVDESSHNGVVVVSTNNPIVDEKSVTIDGINELEINKLFDESSHESSHTLVGVSPYGEMRPSSNLNAISNGRLLNVRCPQCGLKYTQLVPNMMYCSTDCMAEYISRSPLESSVRYHTIKSVEYGSFEHIINEMLDPTSRYYDCKN